MRDKNWFFCAIAFLLTLTFSCGSWAVDDSCFSSVDYVTPKENTVDRALYVIIDETVPLSEEMKSKIVALLKGWGKAGDQVKIARFSASYRGLYPELIFASKLDSVPDKRFMFNLHYQDRERIKTCMQEQQASFSNKFTKALQVALQNINPKIPKSELLGSLKLLSKQLVMPDNAKQKTVLLISDGLENSGTTSFYANKLVRNIDSRKEIAKIRRKGLMGSWDKANVYIYGLGLMPDKKSYSKPEHVMKIRRFWEHYFVESGARVKAIGIPELLLTSID